MARLGDQLGDWLSRVELLARGAEWHRAEGARALEADRPWDARDHALAILDEMPRSRVALALWADAAEAALLDHEVVEALHRLAEQLPFRADVWLRLARARARLGEPFDADLGRAAELGEPVQSADAARLWLADLDLARNDSARAERWLEALSLGGRTSDAALERQLELALTAGDRARVEGLAARLGAPAPLDAAGWLRRARARAVLGDANAESAFVRALLLEAPGALSRAASFVAEGAPDTVRARLAALVEDLGLGAHPMWRAAFARAEGREGDALNALRDGARESGEAELAQKYLAEVIARRDASLLADAAALAGRTPALTALAEALAASGDGARLDSLDRVIGPAADWADALRRETFAGWWPTRGAARWRDVLGELTRTARALGEIEVSRDIESIARDLDRPLRVAIVGEFNAGKSSLINALLGEDVAPVGVLPTTATLNTLVWAPDRFARVERRDGAPDRVVPHASLRATLAEIAPETIERVTLFAPLELLRKIELIDTPGFNAPDAAHAKTARAVFRDAHFILWLLDATQPLKASERRVLEEVRDMGLPLGVLVNKIDRLPGPDDLASALAHVEQGLAEVGLPVEGGVVAFSARMALAGRAGDAEAASASRWGEVERFVEAQLVDQSDELRERALRRQAREIARRMAEVARGRAATEHERAAFVETARTRLFEVEARIAASRAEWERKLAEAFAEPFYAFSREVAPVAGVMSDGSARRFVERRAREVLGRALLDAIEPLLDLGGVEEARAVRRALAPRLEALCAGRALGLAERGRGGGRGATPSAELTDVTRELGEVALDEVTLALATARDSWASTGPSPIFRRALALSEVLSE